MDSKSLLKHQHISNQTRYKFQMRKKNQKNIEMKTDATVGEMIEQTEYLELEHQLSINIHPDVDEHVV